MEQHLERRSRLLLLDRREEALSCILAKLLRFLLFRLENYGEVGMAVESFVVNRIRIRNPIAGYFRVSTSDKTLNRDRHALLNC